MKKGEIAECVERLGLNLDECEQMRITVADMWIPEEPRKSVAATIEAAYEKGQEDLIRELMDNFDEYTKREEEKIIAIESHLIALDDSELEKRYISAVDEQRMIEEALQEILGEDTKYIRVKDAIYLKVGSVKFDALDESEPRPEDIPDDMPWYGKTTGEGPDPYVYDGYMSPEDYERMHEIMTADRQHEEKETE